MTEAWRRAWPRLRRVLNGAFILAVAVLVVVLARRLDWNEVWASLGQYGPRTLLAAGAVAAISFCVYCLFDVLGKHYVGHALPVRQVMPVTFVCYAFNLNLGAWVGGIALRYRLYARLGLRTAQITRIFTFSLLTNWLGYMALAGALFALGLIDPPPGWGVGATAIRLLGAVLLAVVAVYLGLCAFSPRRAFSLRGHEVLLPSPRMALLQVALGATNWSLMGLVVYLMFFGQVPYPTVLAILMISSVAGVITHIPAGLGVLEAVFVALLAGEMAQASVVAGLIGYRAVYFLAPLLLATLVYFALEAQARRLRATNQPPGARRRGA